MEAAYISSGTNVHKGEDARLSSFVGAIAIADLVKTTLGPKGMDKILQTLSAHDQSVSVTNDGATILRSIHVDNPAGKVLVDIAKVQDDEVRYCCSVFGFGFVMLCYVMLSSLYEVCVCL